MINLQDFDQELKGPILERGKKYFQDGAVLDLHKFSKGHWAAEVEGTEDYIVEIDIDKNKQVTDYSCTCPYDGEICKHIIATLFALRKQLVKPAKTTKAAKTKKSTFNSLLKSITLKEYQEFIKSYAADNSNFQTEFELYFAQKDERIDVGQKYDELIKKLISQKTRRGYIEYKNASVLGKEIKKLLKQGQDFISKKNYVDAFALADAALKNLVEVLKITEYEVPDSVYTAINTATDIFEAIATLPDVARDLKLKLLNHLRTALTKPDYVRYGDISGTLEELFEDMALDLGEHEAFLSYLNEKLQKYPKSASSYRDYERRELILSKIYFLIAIGRTAEAEKLTQENLEIPRLRQDKVDEAIENKDFTTAKKLLHEGIKLAEADRAPGTVSDWEKYLLKIAELENDVIKIREFSKKMAIDDGRFSKEYYNKWKATYAPAEWKAVIDTYINRVLLEIQQEYKSNRFAQYRKNYVEKDTLSKLAHIYIQEGYLDRILTLINSIDSLSTTLQFYKILLPQYPAEVQQLLVRQFQEYGQHTSSRSEYKQLATAMRKVVKELPAAGKAIKAVAQTLIDQFPRKPALKEEMLAVLKA